MVAKQCDYTALYPSISTSDATLCANYAATLSDLIPESQQLQVACAYSPCAKLITALRTLPECYWMSNYTNKEISCYSYTITSAPSTGGGATSKSNSTATNNVNNTNSSESSSNTTTYAIIGAVVVIVILIVAIILVYRNKKKKQQREVVELSWGSVNPHNYVVEEYQEDPIVFEEGSVSSKPYYPPPDSVHSVTKTKTRASTGTLPTVSTGTGSSSRSGSDMRASHLSNDDQLDLRDLSLWRIDPQDISLIKTLAQGAFGEVWLGQYMGKHVAIKKLLHHKKSVDQVQKFIQEIKLISKLDSPYIVQFIGVSWARPSEMMFLTEFIPNGDLRDNLEQGTTITKSNYPLKFQIALDIIEGLVYLHSLQPKIIHRDLKSRNILLDSQMRAKLTDFGVSRENNDATMTHNIGTYRWMAPEVLTDNYYNELTDIFSFGVIMTEIDTHDVPYSKLLNKNGLPYTDTAILSQVIKGELIPDLSSSSPKWFKDLAIRCMRLKPDERPCAIEIAYIIRTEMKK